MVFDNTLETVSSTGRIVGTAGAELSRRLQYWVRFFAPAIGLWAGLLVISAPVLAQSIAKNLVCSGAGKLISAIFAMLILALVGFGIYRGINGWRKISSPNPEKKKTGRDEIKGAGMAFVGALFSTGLPNALQSLGLKVFSCIDVTPL